AYGGRNGCGRHTWMVKWGASQCGTVTGIPQPTGETLVETAKMFVGLQYLWAGMSGFGFDCSGFTLTIMQSDGITIHISSRDQATYGRPVEFEDMQPGDLLFFAYENGQGRVHHVGMYAGDGMMIHSPNSKRDVEIIPLKTKEYYEELSSIRRYLP